MAEPKFRKGQIVWWKLHKVPVIVLGVFDQQINFRFGPGAFEVAKCEPAELRKLTKKEILG
jgi:hypothetical protein